MTATTLKLDGLEKLLKALKDNNPPVVRVGVLGDKAQRTSKDNPDGPNNATIGVFHEFGTDRLPVRSFLRLPLSTVFFKRLTSAGAFDKATLNEVIRVGSVEPWIKKVAVVAEATVLEAFDTGGFGTWPPLSEITILKKGHSQILIETGQLRDSITSEVKRANG